MILTAVAVRMNSKAGEKGMTTVIPFVCIGEIKKKKLWASIFTVAVFCIGAERRLSAF